MISIHALAKRATLLWISVSELLFISIHALAKRATSEKTQHCIRKAISIHALAKRATGYHWDWDEKKLFQSTPSQRGRPTPFHLVFVFIVFQSTPSQRGRLAFQIVVSKLPLFQSTPSQRGRQQIYTMIIYILKLNITFRTFFLYKIIKN